MRISLNIMHLAARHVRSKHHILRAGLLFSPHCPPQGVCEMVERNLAVLITSISLMVSLIPSAKAWQLDSVNSKSGITSYASIFWVDGVGPVSKDKFFAGKFKEGAYWSSFTLSCTKKQLSITVSVNQIGSGHKGINFDDPGFMGVSINGALPKSFKTVGASAPSTVIFKSDAPKLLKSFSGKQTVGLTLREVFTTKVLKPKFKIEPLTSARARFKNAGCSI